MTNETYARVRPIEYADIVHTEGVHVLPGEGGGTIGDNYMGRSLTRENLLHEILREAHRNLTFGRKN